MHCEKVQCPRLACAQPVRANPTDCCKQCPGKGDGALRPLGADEALHALSWVGGMRGEGMPFEGGGKGCLS